MSITHISCLENRVIVHLFEAVTFCLKALFGSDKFKCLDFFIVVILFTNKEHASPAVPQQIFVLNYKMIIKVCPCLWRV